MIIPPGAAAKQPHFLPFDKAVQSDQPVFAQQIGKRTLLV